MIDINTLVESPLSRLKILFIVLFRFFYKIIYFLGAILDIFASKYKKIVVKEPLFLIGHPRSGTTFLHRFLLQHINIYSGSLLWEMVVPFVMLRKIIKPLILFISKFRKTSLYDSKIHNTSLLHAETDDVIPFFSSFEGIFFWFYFRAFHEYKTPHELEDDLYKFCNFKSSILKVERFHKKKLYEAKRLKKIFSKSFSFILSIEQLLHRYPDAKIILLIRDPLDVIPSSMSLARSILSKVYNYERLNDEHVEVYYSNLYQASLFFYHALHKIVQKQEKYDKNIILLQYENLKSDFKASIYRLFNYLGVKVTPEINILIQEFHIKQQRYISKHKYSLGEFGLDESKIRKDFKFIYDNYSFI